MRRNRRVRKRHMAEALTGYISSSLDEKSGRDLRWKRLPLETGRSRVHLASMSYLRGQAQNAAKRHSKTGGRSVCQVCYLLARYWWRRLAARGFALCSLESCATYAALAKLKGLSKKKPEQQELQDGCRSYIPPGSNDCCIDTPCLPDHDENGDSSGVEECAYLFCSVVSPTTQRRRRSRMRYQHLPLAKPLLSFSKFEQLRGLRHVEYNHLREGFPRRLSIS